MVDSAADRRFNGAPASASAMALALREEDDGRRGTGRFALLDPGPTEQVRPLPFLFFFCFDFLHSVFYLIWSLKHFCKM